MSDDLKHLGIYSTKRVTYIGTGMTRRKNVQKRYWSVSLDDEGKVIIQALNQNMVPSGRKREITDDEFHERFEFEPDIFAVGIGEGGSLKPLWRGGGDEAEPEEIPLPESQADEGLPEISTGADLFEGFGQEQDSATDAAPDSGAQEARTDGVIIPPELEDEDVFHLELGKEQAGEALMEELTRDDPGMEEAIDPLPDLPLPKSKTSLEPKAYPEIKGGRPVSDMVELSEDELFDILGPDKSGPEVVLTARERRLMEIERNARADFGLGISYLQNGDTKLARKIFEDLAVLDGDFSKRHKFMFNDFGIGLRKSKMLDVALKNYLRVLELAPDDENVYHNIARIHYEKGEMDKAQENLEKALRINPRLEEAKRFLEFIRRKGRKGGFGLRFKI